MYRTSLLPGFCGLGCHPKRLNTLALIFVLFLHLVISDEGSIDQKICHYGDQKVPAYIYAQLIGWSCFQSVTETTTRTAHVCHAGEIRFKVPCLKAANGKYFGFDFQHEDTVSHLDSVVQTTEEKNAISNCFFKNVDCDSPDVDHVIRVWNPNTLMSVCDTDSQSKYHTALLCISFIVGFPAAAMMCYFCWSKNRPLMALHRNLLIALSLRTFFTLLLQTEVILDAVEGSSIVVDNGAGCQTLSVFETFFLDLVLSFWLVDAIYTWKFVSTDFKEPPNVSIFNYVTSGLSLLFTIIWIIVMATTHNESCWIGVRSWVQWINDPLRIIYLLLQLLLLVDILRKITGQKTVSQSDFGQIMRKEVLLLVLLAPFFILQFSLIAGTPTGRECMEAYFYTMYTIDGLQCAVVAMVFFYFDKEAHTAIRELLGLQKNRKLANATPIRTLDSLRENRFENTHTNAQNDVVYSSVLTPDRYEKAIGMYQKFSVAPTRSVTVNDGEAYSECHDSRKLSTISEYYDASSINNDATSISEFYDVIGSQDQLHKNNDNKPIEIVEKQTTANNHFDNRDITPVRDSKYSTIRSSSVSSTTSTDSSVAKKIKKTKKRSTSSSSDSSTHSGKESKKINSKDSQYEPPAENKSPNRPSFSDETIKNKRDIPKIFIKGVSESETNDHENSVKNNDGVREDGTSSDESLKNYKKAKRVSMSSTTSSGSSKIGVSSLDAASERSVRSWSDNDLANKLPKTSEKESPSIVQREEGSDADVKDEWPSNDAKWQSSFSSSSDDDVGKNDNRTKKKSVFKLPKFGRKKKDNSLSSSSEDDSEKEQKSKDGTKAGKWPALSIGRNKKDSKSSQEGGDRKLKDGTSNKPQDERLTSLSYSSESEPEGYKEPHAVKDDFSRHKINIGVNYEPTVMSPPAEDLAVKSDKGSEFPKIKKTVSSDSSSAESLKPQNKTEENEITSSSSGAEDIKTAKSGKTGKDSGKRQFHLPRWPTFNLARNNSSESSTSSDESEVASQNKTDNLILEPALLPKFDDKKEKQMKSSSSSSDDEKDGKLGGKETRDKNKTPLFSLPKLPAFKKKEKPSSDSSSSSDDEKPGGMGARDKSNKQSKSSLSSSDDEKIGKLDDKEASDKNKTPIFSFPKLPTLEKKDKPPSDSSSSSDDGVKVEGGKIGKSGDKEASDKNKTPMFSFPKLPALEKKDKPPSDSSSSSDDDAKVEDEKIGKSGDKESSDKNKTPLFSFPKLPTLGKKDKPPSDSSSSSDDENNVDSEAKNEMNKPSLTLPKLPKSIQPADIEKAPKDRTENNPMKNPISTLPTVKSFQEKKDKQTSESSSSSDDEKIGWKAKEPHITSSKPSFTLPKLPKFKTKAKKSPSSENEVTAVPKAVKENAKKPIFGFPGLKSKNKKDKKSSDSSSSTDVDLMAETAKCTPELTAPEPPTFKHSGIEKVSSPKDKTSAGEDKTPKVKKEGLKFQFSFPNLSSFSPKFSRKKLGKQISKPSSSSDSEADDKIIKKPAEGVLLPTVPVKDMMDATVESRPRSSSSSSSSSEDKNKTPKKYNNVKSEALDTPNLFEIKKPELTSPISVKLKRPAPLAPSSDLIAQERQNELVTPEKEKKSSTSFSSSSDNENLEHVGPHFKQMKDMPKAEISTRAKETDLPEVASAKPKKRKGRKSSNSSSSSSDDEKLKNVGPYLEESLPPYSWSSPPALPLKRTSPSANSPLKSHKEAVQPSRKVTSDFEDNYFPIRRPRENFGETKERSRERDPLANKIQNEQKDRKSSTSSSSSSDEEKSKNFGPFLEEVVPSYSWSSTPALPLKRTSPSADSPSNLDGEPVQPTKIGSGFEENYFPIRKPQENFGETNEHSEESEDAKDKRSSSSSNFSSDEDFSKKKNRDLPKLSPRKELTKESLDSNTETQTKGQDPTKEEGLKFPAVEPEIHVFSPSSSSSDSDSSDNDTVVYTPEEEETKNMPLGKLVKNYFIEDLTPVMLRRVKEQPTAGKTSSRSSSSSSSSSGDDEGKRGNSHKDQGNKDIPQSLRTRSRSSSSSSSSGDEKPSNQVKNLLPLLRRRPDMYLDLQDRPPRTKSLERKEEFSKMFSKVKNNILNKQASEPSKGIAFQSSRDVDALTIAAVPEHFGERKRSLEVDALVSPTRVQSFEAPKKLSRSGRKDALDKSDSSSS